MKRTFSTLIIAFILFTSESNAQTAKLEWVFDGSDAKGWSSLNYKSQEVSGGYWNLLTPDTKMAAFISYWGKSGPKINTTETRKVVIAIINGTPQTTARFYYRYNGGWVFIPFQIEANSNLQDYVIDLSQDAYKGGESLVGQKWKYSKEDEGTYQNMQGIRFDIPSLAPPLKGSGVTTESTNKSVKIKYIKFIN